MFALILSLIMLFSLNSVAHDTVQTRLDKFNENWTNVIAFRGESGKVLIQQHQSFMNAIDFCFSVKA
jgi:hypothetical protein